MSMKVECRESPRWSFIIAFLGVMFVAFGLLRGCGRAEDRAADEVSAAAPEVTAGIEAHAALRAENEALRRENQMLRRELISKNGALPDALMPEKGVARDEGLEPADKETGYWLSSKTKVRHNKRCRNYRRVKGMPCGPNDGRPCKACGG